MNKKRIPNKFIQFSSGKTKEGAKERKCIQNNLNKEWGEAKGKSKLKRNVVIQSLMAYKWRKMKEEEKNKSTNKKHKKRVKFSKKGKNENDSDEDETEDED